MDKYKRTLEELDAILFAPLYTYYQKSGVNRLLSEKEYFELETMALTEADSDDDISEYVDSLVEIIGSDLAFIYLIALAAEENENYQVALFVYQVGEAIAESICDEKPTFNNYLEVAKWRIASSRVDLREDYIVDVISDYYLVSIGFVHTLFSIEDDENIVEKQVLPVVNYYAEIIERLAKSKQFPTELFFLLTHKFSNDLSDGVFGLLCEDIMRAYMRVVINFWTIYRYHEGPIFKNLIISQVFDIKKLITLDDVPHLIYEDVLEMIKALINIIDDECEVANEYEKLYDKIYTKINDLN